MYSHPSIIAFLVASSLFQYPSITFSPLTKISPSSAIFTLQFFSTFPTVSTLIELIGLQLTTGEVSVKPYPCMVFNPSAFRNSPIFGSKGPPPETNVWIFPPRLCWIFFLTKIVKTKFNIFSIKEIFCFKIILVPISIVLLKMIFFR